MKEYRLYGKWGQWGEIHDELEYAKSDLDYCNSEYAEQIADGNEGFVIQERDVSQWRELGHEEDTRAEEGQDRQ